VAIIQNVDLHNPLTEHPLNRGLVGCWTPVAETAKGSLFRDISGYNNHATLHGDAAFAASENRLGLSLDGAGDYATVPGTLGSPSAVSIVMSVSVAAGEQAGEGVSFNDYCTIRPAYGTVGVFAFWFDGNWRELRSNEMIDGTGPRHLTFVCDPDSAHEALYIDSKLQATSTTTSSIVYTGNVQIGYHKAGANYLDGAIYDIRIYNRGLNAAEVRTLYTQSISGYPDLIRRLPTQPSNIPALTGVTRKTLVRI